MYYIDFEKTLPSAEIYKFQNSGTLPEADVSGEETRDDSFDITPDTDAITTLNKNSIMARVNRFINNRIKR